MAKKREKWIMLMLFLLIVGQVHQRQQIVSDTGTLLYCKHFVVLFFEKKRKQTFYVLVLKNERKDEPFFHIYFH